MVGIRKRVMAQRKFAQGAIIPLATSTCTSPKNHTPAPEENVILNKMCAKNLLDIISIQGLDKIIEFEGPNENNNATCNEKPLDIKKQKDTNIKPKPILKSKVFTGNSQRLLRCKAKNKVMVKNNKQQNNMRDKIVRFTTQEPQCDSEDDDNQPLISFAKVNENSKVIENDEIPASKRTRLSKYTPRSDKNQAKRNKQPPNSVSQIHQNSIKNIKRPRVLNKSSNESESSKNGEEEARGMGAFADKSENTEEKAEKPKDKVARNDKNQLDTNWRTQNISTRSNQKPAGNYKRSRFTKTNPISEIKDSPKKGEDEVREQEADKTKNVEEKKEAVREQGEETSQNPTVKMKRARTLKPTNADKLQASTKSVPNLPETKEERTAKNVDASAGKSEANHPSESYGIGKLISAPVFCPSKKEFLDPLHYFESIRPEASKYGICKVIPPKLFKPPCKLNDELNFSVTNQYLSRLYSRWGPVAKEIAAIKAYSASQEVVFARAPLIDGVEVDLPKLYHIVERYKGLEKVIEKNLWGKVAEEMRVTNGPNTEKKIDGVYMKYLLPYSTLAERERNHVLSSVEKQWNKKYCKMLERARNPLHKQKKILQESDSSGEDTEDDDNVAEALAEAEDCIVSGRKMNLKNFNKVASNTMSMYFPSKQPTTKEVEDAYWRFVLLGAEHVCVNAASIDTGEEGYGFTKNKNAPYGKHRWNLKMFSQNENNVLRALGPVLGVTVPTLHVGMVFSTSCWHSDPQGLPWVEYHHEGATKIWYGIPHTENANFRRAVEKLCPTSCQNKSIWLPSDITMIPPNVLCENGVSLARVEQNPGEFIIVFPKAYSCSISTGYTVSESVYFATNSWLNCVHQLYQELRESSEPTMFPLEHLLISVAKDPKTQMSVLLQVHMNLVDIVNKEIEYRAALKHLSSQLEPRTNKRRPNNTTWNVRELDECELCRVSLYLSKVIGMTDKKSACCLEHTKRLLQTPNYANVDIQKLKLILYHSTEELNIILENVRNRLLHLEL